jgi:hypothetical protein
MRLFHSTEHGERGTSRLGFIALLALSAALIYLVVTFAPAYLGNENLREAADEIVRRGALQKLDDTDVRAQLHEKVRELGLPDNHKVDLWHEGRGLAARISYQHVIRFPFYTYNWPVEILVRNVGF